MQQIYPDLWQSLTEHPFAEAPQVTTHAYLLTRPEGNVLLYNSSYLLEDADQIESLGGVACQLLSHRDEITPALADLRAHFGARLGIHAREAEEVRAVSPLDLVFETRETWLDGIEVIPTPGHSPGSTSFRYASPHGKTYLFTGDTIFASERGWETYLIPGSNHSDLVDSLKLLRGLNPDVVISSAAVAPDGIREVTPDQWRRAVDAALEELSALA
ncbi:MAG: MBL fold metallo-hydrolase [Pseudomonadota bacterium]